MSSKNITLTFESPIDELPEPHGAENRRQYQPAEHWLKIGARCFQHEGQWVPVYIDGTLYVRYIDPENHENVTELKGRTA